MAEKVLAAVRTAANTTEIREYPMPDVPADAVTALDWAIDDLMGGRLALGARGATGDGTMGEGELVCRVGPATYPTFTEALRAIRRDPMEAAP